MSYRDRFTELATKWHCEAGIHSSMTMRKRHPAYAEIISVGWSAVPLLLDALVTIPDFWFPLLRDITGENPVLPEERGFYDKMSEKWLAWGRNKGFLN